ncbi:ankyrin repeat domain-containing protein [Chryseobacterium indoltheticum]|uniref:ankyrin repeat domain-containing protein n=1 Tax=Chryseobacterium indoltheticum TaxID=254 RepID=UPI003F4954A7
MKYNKDLVEHLLKKNANPNIADSSGATPLFWAVKFGNQELAELLLKHKADKSLKDSQGMTLLNMLYKQTTTNSLTY